MIREQVKITVAYRGQKYAKTVEIESDGSFVTVEQKVRWLVAKEWVNRLVESYSWYYV
jgi:hypothetical protein